MSYPDINELSTAFTLCTCGSVCTRQCTVCYSTTWFKQPCVKRLWEQHTQSDAGKDAAKRFNDMLKAGDPVSLGEVMMHIPAHFDPIGHPMTDAQIVERTIDFAEELGMYLEPWQAAALRAILLHGGDVCVSR